MSDRQPRTPLCLDESTYDVMMQVEEKEFLQRLVPALRACVGGGNTAQKLVDEAVKEGLEYYLLSPIPDLVETVRIRK